MCKQIIREDEICRRIAGYFGHHAGAVVWCGVHRPMKHIQGFMWSHEMLPLGECMCRIALVAFMVNKFVENTQNTTKKLLLASKYGTNWSLVVCENFVPQKGPSTQLIDVTSCVQRWDNTISADEFAYIFSYQTLSADKNWDSY